MRRIALLSVPTNLGLRPPGVSSVPGCSKAPEALREAGLFRSFIEMGGIDAGVIIPGRYSDKILTGKVRNEDEIIKYSKKTQKRITGILEAGNTPLLIGGDCSLLLGVGLSLKTLGIYGLVHIDGHTDFRHPGNSNKCGSLAGEDLAAVVGLHYPEISNIDYLGPYFEPGKTVHCGCRDNDEHLSEVSEKLRLVIPASNAIADGMAGTGKRIVRVLEDSRAMDYWLHVDLDVLDPRVMPAVDSPDGGGFDGDQLIELLSFLAPGAIGADVTIFDPDLDQDGKYAIYVAKIISEGLRNLGTTHP
ncbi:MAG: arginase family protein [Thermoplasmataceae archaeon]